MRIDTRLDIGDRVEIVDIEKVGVVKGMVVSVHGLEYVVRYPAPGEYHEVQFFEDELRKIGGRR